MATRTSRVLRPLIAVFLLLAAAFATMALVPLGDATPNRWVPRLGLDLQGGQTITLTARSDDPSAITDDSMNQAVDIIRNRVDGLGGAGAEVTRQGGSEITVSVPGAEQRNLVEAVGSTAKLTFRVVYQAAQAEAPPPAPEPDPSAPNPSTPNPGTPNPDSPAASPSPTTNNILPSPAVEKPLNQLPPPPQAPPPPPPSAGGSGPSQPAAPGIPEDKALEWQPTEQALQQFQLYTCDKAVKEVPDQPLITCSQDGTEKYLLGPTAVAGERLTEASAGIPQNELQWAVMLTLNPTGAEQFLKVSEFLMQKQEGNNRFGITLDGRVVSAPTLAQRIADGRAQITGSFSQTSAQTLANQLKYGALPLTFETSDVTQVSAVLGGEQLRAGIIAGIIGLILVAAFALFYYRGLALVVVSSVVVVGALTYALMVLLGSTAGFALDLPGIAGAIIALGATADSFVIYFERIRDEVRDGRSLRSAVETGWKRARQTVVISDMVSLLSAGVLFALAAGPVRGFAFTLGLTTLIDLAVVFWFTKPLMTLLARTKFFGEGGKFSGLNAAHMGVAALPVRRAPDSGRKRTKETVLAKGSAAAKEPVSSKTAADDEPVSDDAVTDDAVTDDETVSSEESAETMSDDASANDGGAPSNGARKPAGPAARTRSAVSGKPSARAGRGRRR